MTQFFQSDLSGVSGLITITGGSFIGSQFRGTSLPTVRNLNRLLSRGVIHASGIVRISESRIAVRRVGTSLSSFFLASSDTSNPVVHWCSVDWDVAEYSKSLGICSASKISVSSSNGKASVQYVLQGCDNSNIVAPPDKLSNQTYSSNGLALSLDFVLSTPWDGSNDVPLSLVQTNCWKNDIVSYEFEVSFIKTL